MSDVNFSKLLVEAVSKPGAIMQAYSAFHNYSTGNQLLAMFQACTRGLEVGPIATYTRWQELGRQVRKGERAIELCMPVTCKRKVASDDADAPETEVAFRRFIFKKNWFLLTQTDGEPFVAPALPEWSRARALEVLQIAEVPFQHTNGNVQGYAKGREIAINPVAQLPLKTTFHEMAHIELGHTDVTAHDSQDLPRSLKEVEAESVALLCLESLQLPGAEFARGYIQSWLDTAEIPERSAQRILTVADRILKAGRPAVEGGVQ